MLLSHETIQEFIETTENKTGLVSCFGIHGLTESLDSSGRGFFLRPGHVKSMVSLRHRTRKPSRRIPDSRCRTSTEQLRQD